MSCIISKSLIPLKGKQLLEPLRGGYRPPEPPGWRLRRERPLRVGYHPPGPPDKRLRRAGGA
eukprot:2019419-Alexandrium_andersonii.AAC.1